MSDVPDGVTLLLGGARSGKSTLAVALGRRAAGPVRFVATARLTPPPTPGPVDDDLAARVARHRAERPAHWTTVETTDVVAALAASPEDALVIVDCVTLWVADALMADGRDAEAEARTAAGVLAARRSPTVLVSNEVGLGVHPETELGREFRDVLGRVNSTLATTADRTLFVAAGRAVRLDDPWSLLS